MLVVITRLYLVVEEILLSTVAHWWSPDGRYLSYAHFDDTSVPSHKFPFYGLGLNIYDEIREVRFPKVCERCFNKIRL